MVSPSNSLIVPLQDLASAPMGAAKTMAITSATSFFFITAPPPLRFFSDLYNINRIFAKVNILSAIERKFAFLGIFLFFFMTIRTSVFSGENRWLVVEKSSRRLYLFEAGRLLETMPCSFGLNPLPPKREKGDLATPEGIYQVRAKRPSRKYYLFVELDYPNLKDVRRAYWEGRLSEEEYEKYLAAWATGKVLNGPLGNGIGIHGGGLYRQGEGRQVRDWTHGCIALSNEDMLRVYRFVRPGTPVLIYNRKRSFFDILQELVVPELEDREGWQGRLRLFLPRYGLELEILLSGQKNGSRRLELVGLSIGAGEPLFFIRDLNGNGALEPLDRFYSRLEGLPGGYRALQEIVLDELPREVLSLKGDGTYY